MGFKNKIGLLVGLNVGITLALIAAYHCFVNPNPSIFHQEMAHARQVGAKDFLWSDDAGRQIRSINPNDFIRTANSATNAVVAVRSIGKNKNIVTNEEQFFTNAGSGVIISFDGYIVTNLHVIKDAYDIEVMLNNKKEYDARVIGKDENTDLALLKIEAQDVPFLEFGNSDSLSVGEWVLAIGNPFKLETTVTAGIISAKARNINILENQGIESFIQTDAVVNPGNSGGALVDLHGRLIGINSAIISQSGNYEGFSFAIPINLAKKVIRDIKEFGVVQRGWMGIETQEIDNHLANKMGLSEVSGVLIAGISADGAAQVAGLQTNDIIVGVDQTPIKTVAIFMEKIGNYRPGDIIKVDYIREGKQKQCLVTLLNQLNSTDMVAIRKDKILTDLGFELRNLDSKEKAVLRKQGVKVVVVYPKSKISMSNIEPGFIITKLDNQPIATVEELINQLQRSRGTVTLHGFYETYPGQFPYKVHLD